MICDCCGRRKRFFESFAAVKYKTDSLNLCVDCNDIAYKVRDAANENNLEEYRRFLSEWKMRAKKPTAMFEKWQQAFLSPLDEKMEKICSGEKAKNNTTSEVKDNG